jgi:hypothetical protein
MQEECLSRLLCQRCGFCITGSYFEKCPKKGRFALERMVCRKFEKTPERGFSQKKGKNKTFAGSCAIPRTM